MQILFNYLWQIDQFLTTIYVVTYFLVFSTISVHPYSRMFGYCTNWMTDRNDDYYIRPREFVRMYVPNRQTMLTWASSTRYPSSSSANRSNQPLPSSLGCVFVLRGTQHDTARARLTAFRSAIYPAQSIRRLLVSPFIRKHHHHKMVSPI
jgi:hypothetical protein